MKNLILILIIFLLNACNKPKSVLICGDHICVNKTEAKQYFEENLSIEVKIIDKRKRNEVNLVELNLNKDEANNKSVSIFTKDNTAKNLKTLTKNEIKVIKKKINEKKNKKNKSIEVVKKIDKKSDVSNINSNELSKIDRSVKKNITKNKIKVVDVCTIIKKCSIEEISKFLIKQGKNKNFPDITIRE